MIVQILPNAFDSGFLPLKKKQKTTTGISDIQVSIYQNIKWQHSFFSQHMFIIIKSNSQNFLATPYRTLATLFTPKQFQIKT